MDLLFPVLASLATLLPIAVAWTVAVALAVLNWGRHRRVSAYVVVGVSILFVDGVAGRLIGPILPAYRARTGMSLAEITVWMTAVSVFLSIVSAAGWAFIVAAIFAERRPESHPASR